VPLRIGRNDQQVKASDECVRLRDVPKERHPRANSRRHVFDKLSPEGSIPGDDACHCTPSEARWYAIEESKDSIGSFLGLKSTDEADADFVGAWRLRARFSARNIWEAVGYYVDSLGEGRDLTGRGSGDCDPLHALKPRKQGVGDSRDAIDESPPGGSRGAMCCPDTHGSMAQ
jgi:hypothetical protein